MRAAGPRSRAGRAGSAASGAGAAGRTPAAGSHTVTRVPPPAPARSTSRRPPARRTTASATESPRPRWPGRVVKKGSKMRGRISGGMPSPTSTRTSSAPPSWARVRTLRVPPAGIASTAFSTRPTTASRSAPAPASTGGVAPRSAVISIAPRDPGSARRRARAKLTASCAIAGSSATPPR